MLAGCAGKQEAFARRQGEAVPVTARLVQPTQWNDTLQALGTAKARESISVTAKVSEIVEKVHFESGQHIAPVPIVTLRGEPRKLALVQAQATFHEADQLCTSASATGLPAVGIAPRWIRRSRSATMMPLRRA